MEAFMKLIIIIFGLIFINFSATAAEPPISKMYEFCNIYKNNNFKILGLDEVKQLKAVICYQQLEAFKNVGSHNCYMLNAMILDYRKQIKTTNSFEIYNKNIALFFANGDISVKQAVLSFINFAEKNPNLFEKNPSEYKFQYLGKVFPCKIKS